ncbi:transposase [Paraburkholderia sp. ZP32-5]|uniref:transposase n=1 Tax=Paraburkholderia sp. ZP32-5 TaxID=2883245 RepID=UPI003FA3AC1F
MNERTYISDEAWQKIAHLFPHDEVQRSGRPRRHPRSVLEGILWILTNNERWHRLPTHYPPAQTCYIKYLQWRKIGVMCEVLVLLELESCEIAKARIVDQTIRI